MGTFLFRKSAAAAAVVLLFSLSGTAAQEYTLLGTVTLEGEYAVTPGGTADNRLEYLAEAEASHRLDYEEFSLIVRHRVRSDRQEVLSHDLEEAYIDWRPFQVFSLGAGKQRISWGRGLAFFPTDTLHPSRTRTDTEGFTGLSFLYTPGTRFQLTGAADLTEPLREDSLNEDFYRHMKFALNAGLFLGNADLALTAVYGRDLTFRPGLGISLDLGGFILTAEGALELDNAVEYPDPLSADFREDPAAEPRLLVSGGVSRSLFPHRTPDLSLTFAAEYLYAGTGCTPAQEARYFQILDSWLTGGNGLPDLPYLGRHYLFVLAGMEWTGRFSLELSGYLNLQDRSASLAGKLVFTGISGLDLYGRGGLLLGEGDTEFGAGKPVLGEKTLALGGTVYF